MWKFIKAARRVLGRGARAILAVAAFALITAAPSHAAVEYERVCSLYGAGFFYIPGTDTCTSAYQTVQDQFAIARALTRASTGTAMAAALVNPFLPDGTNYAISTHWAVFDGQHSVGLAGLMRLRGNLALSAGVAVGLDQGSLLSSSNRTQTEFGTSVPAQSWSDVRVLGRVGLQYSW
jgi:Porin subfamily